jgi:hypothetical protein
MRADDHGPPPTMATSRNGASYLTEPASSPWTK